ncbi:isochorismatase family protein [Prochlorococcus sp. MIT 1341]|uniref:isochorismatase family protein n=1 Tax=Prochlorococcus sp. MIT 1341 TaxID=3096221 RepID=UPI002A751966|nr:isochorismatase family protein [Prochlorococcus sp. MIT 1341]
MSCCIRIKGSDECVLLVIDVQEKLVNVINDSNILIWNIKRLINGFTLLNIPIQHTEQAPDKLGKTINQISPIMVKDALKKTKFSAVDSMLLKILSNYKTKNIVVCGIEAHICVLQTVLDLIEQDFNVFVVADAIASRNNVDKEFALTRAMSQGASLTTTESILFEICNNSIRPEFKELSTIIKEIPSSKN